MKKFLLFFALIALFTTNATAETFEAPVTHIDLNGKKTQIMMRFWVTSEKEKHVSIYGFDDKGFHLLDDDDYSTIHNCLVSENDNKPGEIIVPETVNGYTVNSVDHYAFSNCVAKVTLPESILFIYEHAFYRYLYDGYDFKLPSRTWIIFNFAFDHAKIKGISLNASLNTIQTSAFQYSDIESLVISGSVATIGTSITAGCKNLKYLAVIYTNELQAHFHTYYSIDNVIMDRATKRVIAGCKSSIIPGDAKYIGKQAFEGIDFSNTTVTIPESVDTIDICAFQNTNIKHLIIHQPKQIGTQAFYGCEQMERIDFYGGSMTMLDNAFLKCTALKEVWCHDHKPNILQGTRQFENIGPNWSAFNGQTKLFAKYPDEFTDEVNGENIWKKWFYSKIYGLDENPVISSIYLDDYTWPLAGEDADFTATSLTPHATVSKIEYRYGTKIINPSPYSVGDTLDIAFTITLDEGYTFADDATLSVCGHQNDIVVNRSSTERAFIIQKCAVPVPPGGMPIESISISVEEPVEGQPLSTKVTSPTGRFYDRVAWVIDSVKWTGGNLNSYDPDQGYTLTAYVHAKTDYTFSPDIDAKLNGRTAGVTHGMNSEGIPTLEFSIHYGLQAYTVFDEDNNTLTYYYDGQMDSRPGVKEVYDPEVVRFKDYKDKVVKAVIDPSMKNAPLTSTKNMFFGKLDKETGGYIFLYKLTSIEGLENLNTENVTTMYQMFAGCEALKSIDVSSFNTANVMDITAMFFMCSSLTSLDLTNFNTDNMMSMKSVFSNCSSLTTIYCNEDWSKFDIIEGPLFMDCTALVGGKGTKYDESVVDKTYARPDGGKDKPGYFTRTAPTLIDYIGLELTPRMSKLEKGDKMPHGLGATSWGTEDLSDAGFKVESFKWYYAEKANEDGDGLMPLSNGDRYDPATHYVLMTSFRADEEYDFADDINVEILFDYYDNIKTPVYSNRSTDSDGRNVLMVMFDCPAAVVKGDVDGNGVVNSADVVAIYNFILGGEGETGITKEAADVDGNGEVNSADVVAVYNIIIGE